MNVSLCFGFCRSIARQLATPSRGSGPAAGSFGAGRHPLLRLLRLSSSLGILPGEKRSALSVGLTAGCWCGSNCSSVAAGGEVGGGRARGLGGAHIPCCEALLVPCKVRVAVRRVVCLLPSLPVRVPFLHARHRRSAQFLAGVRRPRDPFRHRRQACSSRSHRRSQVPARCARAGAGRGGGGGGSGRRRAPGSRRGGALRPGAPGPGRSCHAESWVARRSHPADGREPHSWHSTALRWGCVVVRWCSRPARMCRGAAAWQLACVRCVAP